jgi:tetratricopeptide (TPR) repeat protein
MAYVRRRGKQLLIVHGSRDPDTGQVRQEVLLTLYSQGEALAALGKKDPSSALLLEQLLAHQYPHLRLNWKRLRAGIEDNLEALPAFYDHKEERLLVRFRDDLRAFVRQLMLADPQSLFPASRLVEEHRAELEYVADLVAWRLEVGPQTANEWNRDNPFYWRFALQGRDLPPDILEHGTALLGRRELGRAEAAFRLATECFPDDPLGWKYLGVVALDRGEAEAAIPRFREAVERARRRLPRRLTSKAARRHDAWRAYESSLACLAQAEARAGKPADALETCRRLEQDGGDKASIGSLQASIHLDTGAWVAALEAAEPLRRIWPSESFIAGFAAFELGRPAKAREMFLHGALNQPRTARILARLKVRSEPEAEEVRDHNSAVDLLNNLPHYLGRRSAAARRFLRTLLRHPRVAALLDEKRVATRRWHTERSGGTSDAYRRMMEMQDVAFARHESVCLASPVAEGGSCSGGPSNTTVQSRNNLTS